MSCVFQTVSLHILLSEIEHIQSIVENEKHQLIPEKRNIERKLAWMKYNSFRTSMYGMETWKNMDTCDIYIFKL